MPSIASSLFSGSPSGTSSTTTTSSAKKMVWCSSVKPGDECTEPSFTSSLGEAMPVSSRSSRRAVAKSSSSETSASTCPAGNSQITAWTGGRSWRIKTNFPSGVFGITTTAFFRWTTIHGRPSGRIGETKSARETLKNGVWQRISQFFSAQPVSGGEILLLEGEGEFSIKERFIA